MKKMMIDLYADAAIIASMAEELWRQGKDPTEIIAWTLRYRIEQEMKKADEKPLSDFGGEARRLRNGIVNEVPDPRTLSINQPRKPDGEMQ